MKVRQPCDDCPFRREGGVRLDAYRIREIVDAVAPEDGAGASFQCHKTTGVCGPKKAYLSCAGGIIFGYKQGVSSQMTRIEERLGFVPRAWADDDWPEIFDDLDEMLESALDRPRTADAPRSRRARRRTPRAPRAR